MTRYDAVVVGSGPNGLTAAIVLARAGLKVAVFEAASSPGGGARSEPLTLPGFLHDVCSAVHPLGIGSPYLQQLPLASHGLTWIQPPAPLAHPFDDGKAALLERSTDDMAPWIGTDAARWKSTMDPFVARWPTLAAEALGPLHVPRHPLLLARFGLLALLPTTTLTRRLFKGRRARALFAGMAAHATLPLNRPPSAAFGLILGLAGHAVGWPIPEGGSASITRALVSYLRSLGGEVLVEQPIGDLRDLPSARATLLDLTAPQLLRVMGDRLPPLYSRQLQHFQPGLGTFKVDWALEGAIPWTARECTRSATVHLGGTLEGIHRSRQSEWSGRPADHPYVLLVQPSLFDPSRAPAGKSSVWAYCHVPNGSTADMTDRIEAQVERFAPGFKNRIIGRHTMGPAQFEHHNANLVGGDISGGEATLLQLFMRPAIRPVPYTTPLPDVFVCSSSTPPGGGVHGMCGYHAARVALRHRF